VKGCVFISGIVESDVSEEGLGMWLHMLAYQIPADECMHDI
jgi:hypothetical protein